MNKTLCTSILFVALGFTACSNNGDDEGQPISLVLRIILVIITVIIGFAIVKATNIKEEEKINKIKQAEDRLAQLRQKEIAEKNARAKEKQKKDDGYESLYGVCAKEISNPNDFLRDYIRVYENSSIILINDVKYGFEEIIGYNLTDNSTVVKGGLSSSTSTSSASAIGRAVVGAALGGVAGAIIGGSTAKQTTEYKQGDDKTIHDYSININVNRLSEPLVKLHLGKNEDLANEISALINAIVVRNNK